MSIARLLLILALLMLALPAPLKASCCPQEPAPSEQSPDMPPCHSHGEDDGKAPGSDDGCDGHGCSCRAPADFVSLRALVLMPMQQPAVADVAVRLPPTLLVPPQPPPIA